MFNDLITATQPLILEAIIAGAAALLYSLLGGHFAQKTLHSALRTGVQEFSHLLDDGKITRAELIELGLTYARKSSPGAIRSRGATEDVMRSIAASKINEIRGAVRGAVP